MRWQTYGGSWPEYVPVHRRIEAAQKKAAKWAKALGRPPEPVKIARREIAKTFWGRSWCRHLESFADFANRLPRGRTYARNGSVVDLLVVRNRVEAIVAGSTPYSVAIAIAPLSAKRWGGIKTDCATSIGSLVDLLTGRLDDDVMRRLTRPDDGMFPMPREISVTCSCPDGAGLCKHLAAVLYAIGHRLDTQPELLFLLRGVDQTELVAVATKESVSRAVRGAAAHALATDDVAAIFGIDMGGATEPPPATPVAASRAKRGSAIQSPAAPAARSKSKGMPQPGRKPNSKPKPAAASKSKPKPKRRPAEAGPRRPGSAHNGKRSRRSGRG